MVDNRSPRKILVLHNFQQQAEALATQFEYVHVFYNAASPFRNLKEILASERLQIASYQAVNYRQEIAAWIAYIQELRPDVVYANGFRQLLPLSLYFRWKSWRPLVVSTSHNSLVWRSAFSRWRISLLYDLFADGVFPLARFQEKWLRQTMWNRHKVEYIPNPVDVDQFCPDEASSFREKADRLRIIVLADLTPIKGHETLFRAFAKLLPEFGMVELLILGRDISSNNYSGYLQHLVSELGLKSNVVFMGDVLHADLPALLRSVDLSILPSFHEVCSYAVLESMAAGLPLLVSDAGGNIDLVQDGVHGFVFQRGNIDELTQKLRQLLARPDLRKAMGDESRNRAVESFALEPVGIRHRAFIERLLASEIFQKA